MSANIRLDDPKDGKDAWLHRRELLFKTFLKYQPDILACQEVSPAQGAYLRRELASWYSFYPRAGVGSASRTSATTSSASELLGVFSDVISSINTIFYRTDRFDILDGEAGLVIPSEPQANASENTFFTLAVLRERRSSNPAPAHAGTLIVVDVHFRHNEAFAVRCANQLYDIITRWQTQYPNSGILLLGDINFDRTSKLHGAITADRSSGKLADTFDYAKLPPAPANKNGTYHAFTGNPAASLPTDLMFYGGGLKLAAPAEILRDKSADGRYPTDHFLIQAAFQW
jgi:endonuclease/exonuclease/phosphatase family metal-dependent hydrolase